MADPHTDEQRFTDYIAAFNRHDYSALEDYYDPDVLLVNGTGAELRGRQAIFDYYRGVNASTTRTIRILDACSDGTTLAAELESEFLALEDAPDFPSGALARGDRLYINSFAFYDLKDRRFTRIRAAVFRREWKRVASSGVGPGE